jgi:eukaryotic-like serine/threonine-protein kinase
MNGAALVPSAGVQLGELFAGKYLVTDVIGEGGMGIVLRAEHVDLDRPVAIKLVRDDLAAREEIVGRLFLEARAAAKLRSEHVARVLDFGRLASGAPFIVMEYLEGEDLASVLLVRDRLERVQAVDFVLQACEALAEAHAAGIVHRDLKPENLFVTQRPDGSPCIKLLDFGISKDLSRPAPTSTLTNPTNAVGSPHYMAPEQMRPGREIDARADIWALGAILYELVTGISPFDSDTIPGVCARVLEAKPAPMRMLDPSIPQGLDAAVRRCLEKRRERRFSDVAELAAALSPFGSRSAAEQAERVSRVGSGIRARRGRGSSTSELLSSVAPSIRPVEAPLDDAVLAGGSTRSALGAFSRVFTLVVAGAAIAGGLSYRSWIPSSAAPPALHPAVVQAAPSMEVPVVPAAVAPAVQGGAVRELTLGVPTLQREIPKPPARPRARNAHGPVAPRTSATVLATAAAGEVVPEAAPAQVQPPRAAPKTAPAERQRDAWNPGSFGGRR